MVNEKTPMLFRCLGILMNLSVAHLLNKPCSRIKTDDTKTQHIISIFHGCMVWIEKSFTRVTDRHHEACRVMPNSDPE